jgi:hypothetical protein
VNELERVEAAALRDGVVLGGGRAELVGGAICVAQPRMPIMELNRALPTRASRRRTTAMEPLVVRVNDLR